MTDPSSVTAALPVVAAPWLQVSSHTDITGGALQGDLEAKVLEGIPVGRKGTTSDVADLIAFLCRPESGYITGATYDVNGGSHIH